MIDEQPEISQPQLPTGKLILPGYPQTPSNPVGVQEPQNFATSKEQPGSYFHTPPVAPPPISRDKNAWRKDPAYKVLIVAIALVIIVSIVFTTFTSNIIGQISLLGLGQYSTIPQTAPTNTVQGTVDLHPTFPTPSGGNGSTTSSQPQIPPTPVLHPTGTPTAQATTTPIGQGGPLTLQISNIPSQVRNDSDVAVSVTANESGVSVRLYVTYNAFPNFYSSGTQITDNNGNATLSWRVRVSGRNQNGVIAHVVAVGQDQNGKQASSQMVTVSVF
jgi:hypothetical protein